MRMTSCVHLRSEIGCVWSMRKCPRWSCCVARSPVMSTQHRRSFLSRTFPTVHGVHRLSTVIVVRLNVLREHNMLGWVDIRTINGLESCTNSWVQIAEVILGCWILESHFRKSWGQFKESIDAGLWHEMSQSGTMVLQIRPSLGEGPPVCGRVLEIQVWGCTVQTMLYQRRSPADE